MRSLAVFCSACSLLFLIGCGGGESSSAPVSGAASTESNSGSQTAAQEDVVRTASAGAEAEIRTASAGSPVEPPDAEDTGSEAVQEAAPSDPVTQKLQEIVRLRVAPTPAGSAEEVTAIARERNQKIILLATEVLRETLDQTDRLQQFNQAIGQLLESRFQLALTGTAEDVEQLYADVELLNEQSPESDAAAEGIHYLARFSHTQARLQSGDKTTWFVSFAHWAREFADRFPAQQQRAAALLFAAGRSCELHQYTAPKEETDQLRTESRLCYETLAEKWPTAPQGEEALAVLRRLDLPGSKLSQFSGPTIDGALISAQDLLGRIAVVYFWESDDEQFLESTLPKLKQAAAALPSDRIRFLGVAFDEDEAELNQFLDAQMPPGRQIYYPAADQRSWNSPLVRFWGISRLPTIWIIDADGTVVTTSATAETLAGDLRPLFTR